MSDARIIEDMSNADYLAADGYSGSDLVDIYKCPYKWKKEKEEGKESTKSQKIGTALHAAVLEPDLFGARYARQEKYTGKGSVAKNREWEALHQNQVILSAKDYDIVLAMRDNIRGHETAQKLLSGKKETSIMWTSDTGLPCKARPDSWGTGWICNLKTAGSAEQAAFEGAMTRWNYHVSAAQHVRALRALTGRHEWSYTFVVVETVPPAHALAFYELDDCSLESGMAFLEDAEPVCKEAISNGFRDHYHHGEVVPVSVRKYAL